MWPFTSYAPHGKFMTATGFDLSFEELRYEEMRLIKVEHASREEVVARTNTLLEQARHSLQQYYDAVGSMSTVMSDSWSPSLRIAAETVARLEDKCSC